MKSFTLSALAAAGMVQMASAHLRLYGLDADVTTDANAPYVQFPETNSPVTDVTSSLMNCNSGKATTSFAEVAAGSKITTQWGHDKPNDDIIAESHHGPIMFYISEHGKNSWVKIAEQGFSGDAMTTSAVDELIKNKGLWDVSIPNIKAGEYDLRGEPLALHEGNNVAGAQFYPNCMQIKVTGSGSTALPAGVAGPSLYKAEDAGVHYNMYNGGNAAYEIPGPALWDGASSGGSSPAPAPASSSVAAAAPTSTKAAAPATSSAAAAAPPAATSSAAAPAAPKPTTTSAPAAPPAATKPVTLITLTRSTTTTVAPGATSAPAPGNGASGSVEHWGRCGGIGYTGATTCADAWKCVKQNDYYYQCLSQ